MTSAKWHSRKLQAPLTETLKNKQTVRALLEFCKTVKSLQQSSNRWYQEKGNLKTRKALWWFYLPLPHDAPSLAIVMKIAVPISNVGSWSLVLKGAEHILFTNDSVYLFLTCLGATWRTNVRCLALVFPNLGLLQAGKAEGTAWKLLVRANQQPTAAWDNRLPNA